MFEQSKYSKRYNLIKKKKIITKYKNAVLAIYKMQIRPFSFNCDCINMIYTWNKIKLTA